MKEALKLALEALEDENSLSKMKTARDIIRKALAQPEQEPVAYFNPQVKGGFYWAKPTKITAPVTVSVEPMPLYTAPPQPKEPEQEPVPAAMKTVIEAMQQDPDYAWGWHCNIAMSFVDAGGDHYTGNQGAARFMRTLANVEPAHELPPQPPQRKPLDIKTIKRIATYCDEHVTDEDAIEITRRVEAAHNIKE